MKPEERNEFKKWHIKKHAMSYYREMLFHNKYLKYLNYLWIALFSFLLIGGVVLGHVWIISGLILIMLLATLIPICGDA